MDGCSSSSSVKISLSSAFNKVKFVSGSMKRDSSRYECVAHTAQHSSVAYLSRVSSVNTDFSRFFLYCAYTVREGREKLGSQMALMLWERMQQHRFHRLAILKKTKAGPKESESFAIALATFLEKILWTCESFGKSLVRSRK